MKIDIKTGKDQIHGAEDTFEIMQKIFFKRRKKVDILKEHFWTIALNRVSKIVLIELVSIGSNGQTLAGPQEVFRLPLYKGASHLILVHNHLSGSVKPSQADLDITNRLIQVGDMMDIEVLDHVIVAENSYYSFCDMGLIEKLRWDSKYALTFIREKQVAREVEKIKKEAKDEKREVAKSLLKQGVDVEVVKKATGLTSQLLGRLRNEVAKTLQEE